MVKPYRYDNHMKSDKTTLTLSQEVDADEFFCSLLGSAWETWDWWHSAEFINGYEWDKYPTNWDEPFLTVGICDPDDDDEFATVTKTLCLNDLLNAYRQNPVGRWDDHDACTGDAVFQTAVLGTVVYG